MDSYDEYSKFIISEVIRLRERGYSYKDIANNFNDRGIRSRRNRVYYKNLLVIRMWSVQSDKIKQHKKRVNYTINKYTIDRFKVVADKDMRKMSNIVENLIRRYVESRV